MKLPIIFACLFLFTSACTTTQVATGKAKPYPLDTCIVSDNELGSMGDPVAFVYEGQEYKVCCKPCIKKFRKNPDLYIEAMQAKLRSSD